jgi:hypothetical protein
VVVAHGLPVARQWGLAFDNEMRGRRGFAAVWLERGQ